MSGGIKNPRFFKPVVHHKPMKCKKENRHKNNPLVSHGYVDYSSKYNTKLNREKSICNSQSVRQIYDLLKIIT